MKPSKNVKITNLTTESVRVNPNNDNTTISPLCTSTVFNHKIFNYSYV